MENERKSGLIKILKGVAALSILAVGGYCVKLIDDRKGQIDYERHMDLPEEVRKYDLNTDGKVTLLETIEYRRK